MFRKSSDGAKYRQSFSFFYGKEPINMSGSNGRRVRHSVFGTGFYIALFLCAATLAVALYWTLTPKDTAAETAAPVPVVVDEPPVSMPELPAPAREVEPVVEIVEPPEDVLDEFPTLDVVPDVIPVEPRLIVSPLNGETVAAFSVDALTYNETLGDWRTHDGIDIAADVGTPVLAACSGTVTAVTEDDLLGTCVTITHDGGYESTYANLQSVPTVGEGQYVSAGQIIGSVGTTSLIEAGSAAHLHFAVKRDGVSIDPKEFLK